MQNEHTQGRLSLDIGGKKRTLFFDYVFLSLLFEQFSTDTIDEVFANQVYRALPIITCYSLLAGEEENDLPDGFNERTAAKWLRDVTNTDQAAIMEGYKQSMGFMTVVFGSLMNPEPQKETLPKPR